MNKVPGEHKVVVQLTNNDTLVQKSMIRQLNNILNAFEKIKIEVVVHGPGIELLLNKSPLKNNVALLNQKGVAFLACQNTLNEKKIDRSELLPLCTVVPSGIAHIIVRQSEGWSYIKAGF